MSIKTEKVSLTGVAWELRLFFFLLQQKIEKEVGEYHTLAEVMYFLESLLECVSTISEKDWDTDMLYTSSMN